MTAHIVCELHERHIPQLWVLHEWWPGQMLVDELEKRNDKNTNPEVVAKVTSPSPQSIFLCSSACF